MIHKFLNTASKALTLGALAAASVGISQAEEETVKVGILHSLSGTMAISETSLRDVLLFTFDEINANGGVLGKQIEAVVADGASDWPVFAEKSEQLLAQDKCAAVFGCWTSVSRKFALPVFEKYKGLLFYPVQYEGEEESPNIIYTAEAVGQQAIPAVDYLLAEGYKKFYLIGTDYVYPQTTNIVLFEYLLSKGIPVENIGGGIRYEGDVAVSAGNYTPFGHTDFQQIVADIKGFAASGDACVINTINGDANVPFFKEIAASGLSSDECPIVSFSLSEDEFRSLPTKDLVGHLGCWTYFMSIDSPANDKFKADFQAWLETKAPDAVQKEGRVTCSPMVLSYNGVYLWKAAVEKAGTFDPEAVIKALEGGISFDGPGGTVTSQENHHVTKSVYIGETLEDGQFEILEVIPDVVGEPWLKGTFN
ncbi:MULTISPECIES: transporter substrate-binding protein [unclassified Lentimonas]|uniref:transporter substrate-binding protein n=1 Tax=unclassified Lentimonas TaxID=2630993 RepID=UPI00132BEED7|nr:MULTISPECIES: transporter substrate-binding protein [unclassified Lentimonas]CAA6678978.1 Urea ABC transporter, substrate binding protein UrtA [Lentimonas sp. CC4]CAA6685131.1 Urea ABC transporter, substrate binding protein UrtA [Lentimonas sp. CC6]CAA7075143.1 Urea ABC transporter, substrate binding protein UrtA [Lentimonas sp. CC4]CAA7168397.1 Urea ABC transporter, substrate binding protein UrtA [Lentimonas sp. CC21]CAA7179988.1 Urea ABC transporter, substrate binding protein UrtA [Lentim